MKTLTMVLLFCLFSLTTATAEKIYKWRDENGTLRFSDMPPMTPQDSMTVTTTKDSTVPSEETSSGLSPNESEPAVENNTGRNPTEQGTDLQIRDEAVEERNSQPIEVETKEATSDISVTEPTSKITTNYDLPEDECKAARRIVGEIRIRMRNDPFNRAAYANDLATAEAKVLTLCSP